MSDFYQYRRIFLLLTLMSSYASSQVDFSNLEPTHYSSKVKKSKTAGNSYSIGDYVWYDYNQNGKQDLGEMGLYGIPLSLYDNANCSGSAIANTKSSDFGRYEFNNLSLTGNTYCVALNFPTNYRNLTSDGATTKITNITPTSGNIDFGIFHKSSTCKTPFLVEGEKGHFVTTGNWAKRTTLNVKFDDVLAYAFCHEYTNHGPNSNDEYTVHSSDRLGFTAQQKDRLSRVFRYMSDEEILSLLKSSFPETSQDVWFNIMSNAFMWYYSDWKEDFSRLELYVDDSSWSKDLTTEQKSDLKSMARLIVDKTAGSNGQSQYPPMKVYYLWNTTNDTRQDLIVPETSLVPTNTECSAPQIKLEKSTNGLDADTLPGPTIAYDADVTWSYEIKNTGNVPLEQIEITDDRLGLICKVDTLAVNKSKTCKHSGKAVTGQYSNMGTVKAKSSRNIEVTDSDPSHYVGGDKPAPAIDIEVATNGIDADKPTGPKIGYDETVTWNYLVKNSGNVALKNIVVTDDKLNQICTLPTLAVGATKTCTKEGKATEGQYGNVGTVNAESTLGVAVTDSDPSHYLGGEKPAPAVDIEVATNGEDADKPTGPSIVYNGNITWSYVVKNSGNVPLKEIVVTDSQLNQVCTIATLDVGKSTTCAKDGKATEGQYENKGTVIAKSPKGTEVKDSDMSHYIGEARPSTPPLAIDDKKSGLTGQPVTLDSLVNDKALNGTLDATSVNLTHPNASNSGKRLVVQGEGVWEVNPTTGAITFTPEVGFTADPTPITYTVEDSFGNLSNVATESIDYPQTKPTVNNDSAVGERCKPIVIDVLKNDTDAEKDINVSSVNLVVPDGWSGTDSDNDGDIDTLVAPEGKWSVDANGKVTFTSTDGCDTTSPTPIAYSVMDKTGKTSNSATITVVYPDALKGSLGNFVWFDADKNGKQDAGESGLDGVTVELYNSSDELNQTTQTDENGTYIFVNLDAGEYSVKFIPKEGLSITLQNSADANESTDSDADVTTGKTATITLNEGDKNMGIDAGMYTTPKPSISVVKTTNGGNIANIIVGDTIKWRYLIKNTGNQPLLDIKISDDKEGIITECRGDGSLALLNPTKSITCVKTGTAILGAYSNSVSVIAKDAEDTNVTATDSSSYVGKEAPVATGSIGDYVWLDSNRNGIQEGNELPLKGVLVELFDATNRAVAQTTTNDSGHYLFSNIAVGIYSVKFHPSSGYTITQKDRGGDDTKDSDVNPNGKTDKVTLHANENITSVDMGLYPKVALLGNRVWYDEDRDGIQDIDEKQGVSGVIVKLYAKDGTSIAQTKTGASGIYEFQNLVAGQYYVVFEAPDNYNISPQNVGNNESTDSDAKTDTGRTDTVTLLAGVDNRTVDMGLYQTAGKVGDRVWYDSNKNGRQDQGENGIGGVIVKLYRVGNDTAVAETKTTATGIYSFENISAGEYYIIFTASAGYSITEANKGDDDTRDSDADREGRTANFTVESGTQNSTIDMGLYQDMVSYGDRVWLDTNHNGIQDRGETGVKDIKVILYSANSDLTKTTLTDENGNYLFTHLPAGEYSAEFQNVPYGYLVTEKDANNNESDLKDSDVFVNENKALVTEITLLTPGKNDFSWDMGIYKTVCLPGKAVLGNLVWEDFNKNGIQDIGERGVPNVTVSLYNNDTDVKVATVKTNENGLYEFANLDPDFSYYIQFMIPSGYVVSPENQDDDIIDSDADATGKTDVITLVADQINSTVDMGIHHEGSSLGDRVWFDELGGISNGIQDEGENGVADVTVTLYNSSGDTVQTTQTNASGEYHFTDISKGRYTIGFSNLPTGYIFTLAEQGTDEQRDSDVNANGRTDTIIINGVNNFTHIDAGIKQLRVGESSNDIKRGTTGHSVTIDVLANDIEGSYSFDATTVRLGSNIDGATLSEDGRTLTVPTEGVWQVNPTTGEISFTPNEGFVGDPTAISYTVQDSEGNESGAEVQVDYPPVANNDSVNAEIGKPVIIYVTDNDTNTSSPIDKPSVRIIDPTNGNEVEILTVEGQGTWATNNDGSITFTPEEGFRNNPTPIEYVVREVAGDVSNHATVTVIYPDAVDDVVSVPANHTGAIEIDVAQNDSNNTTPSTVTLGCSEEGVKTLTIKHEGVWSVDENGIVSFTPEAGFNGEPRDIEYTIGLVSGERSNCATIDIRYELLARDDSSTLNVGMVSLINILNNDFGSLNPESVQLVIPSNAPAGATLSDDGRTLTVPNEGVWSVNAQGVVSFTAEDGFASAPTPILYTVENGSGQVSNQATITLTQGGIALVANDDIAIADGRSTVTINVLENDNGDLNSSSVQLIAPDGSYVRTLEVEDEGTWTVNDDGTVTFTGFAGYTGTPTPIRYIVMDNSGERSNPASITITGQCICKAYEESIPAMGEVAAVIMVLLTLLLSTLLFKEEENIKL